jgi:hypothetical protein
LPGAVVCRVTCNQWAKTQRSGPSALTHRWSRRRGPAPRYSSAHLPIARIAPSVLVRLVD